MKEEILAEHLDETKEWVVLYPSYWLYNAGIVGILRALDNFDNLEAVKNILDEVKNDGVDNLYVFEKTGEVKIHRKVWSELPRIYVEVMEESFGQDWFYSSVFKQTKESDVIFPNNVLINTGLKNRFLESDFGVLFSSEVGDKVKVGKYSLTGWKELFFTIDMLEKYKFKENDFKDGCIKNYKFKNIKEIYESEDVDFKNYILASLNKLYARIKESKKDSLIWKDAVFQKDLVIKGIKKVIVDRIVDDIMYEHENKKNKELCSFCGNKAFSKKKFGMNWFSSEGGSVSGAENTYWRKSSQPIICGVCQFVLFFIPLGIIRKTDRIDNLNNVEFINIPDAEILWKINKYRLEMQKLEGEKNAKFINTITSTGALLSLKNKWSLQNIEFVEIGGMRKNTVYNLEVSTVASELISNNRNYNIIKWIDSVEKIYYTKSGSDIKGKRLVQHILNNEKYQILKYCKILFKEYIQKKYKYSDSINSLINICISLEKQNESEGNFLRLGKEFSKILKGEDKEIIKGLSSKIFANKKEDFIQEIIKFYAKNAKPLPNTLLDMISEENSLVFQLNAMSFILAVVK